VFLSPEGAGRALTFLLFVEDCVDGLLRLLFDADDLRFRACIQPKKIGPLIYLVGLRGEPEYYFGLQEGFLIGKTGIVSMAR